MEECNKLGLFNTRIPRFSQLFFYNFTEDEISQRTGQPSCLSCCSGTARSYLCSEKRLYSKCGISEILFNYMWNNQNLYNGEGPHQSFTPSSPGLQLHLEPTHASTLCAAFGPGTNHSCEEPGASSPEQLSPSASSEGNAYQDSQGSFGEGGDPAEVTIKLEEMEGMMGISTRRKGGTEDIDGSVGSESQESEVEDVEMSVKSREGEDIEGFSEPELKEREMKHPPKGAKGASRSLDDRAGTPEEESYFPSEDMPPSYMQQLFCLLDDYDATASKPMAPAQSREGGRSTGSDGASDEEEEASIVHPMAGLIATRAEKHKALWTPAEGRRPKRARV